MLFSIMELFTKACTNHCFTFKGKERLGFSSGPDCFPFAGFFLHCKYILFVNLQIFFLLICEEDFFLSNISRAKVLFYVVVVFF
jgi:hypothetical protein